MVSNANTAFAAALAAALADLGLTDVCVSPGSRNTPLTLAFAARDDLTCWVHHDERGAGFFGLGLARASRRPVALVCTSGTAATEYFPAITEALQTGAPLIVITADRPPELRDVGAPQTIDQIDLYGNKVKWFHHGAPPDLAAAALAPDLAAHAWGEAMGGVPGPVHLNLPFREPLVTATVDDAALDEGARVDASTPTPMVRPARVVPPDDDVAEIARALAGRRALFVVGHVEGDAPDAIAGLARSAGAAVFVDPQSGLRAGPNTPATVPYADLLAAAGALDRLTPEIVVRWGSLPTSKATWRWLDNHRDVPQLLIDPRGRDPLGSCRWIVRADPGAMAAAIRPAARAPSDWMSQWSALGSAAADAVRNELTSSAFPNEPAIAATVFASAPQGAALFAGSSMPIRDIDTFAAQRQAPLSIYANRGANGIDGSVSTAAGIAASGRPTVALIGDVAALHDVGALATVARMGLPLTTVVVHNDGGGIFSLLQQADPSVVEPMTFERFFGTPHGTDFVAVAEAFGLKARSVTGREELAELVGATGSAPLLIQVHTERQAIVPLRNAAVAAVRDAIRQTLE
ncbi:MAG TPA: 2-succinyl-5-enolpyruvyl-6-hydroxy-3-cyclohexene-1-carboxylic-acid synthase [Acidimicrobiia bacterium]|nr:2-succinyl-5-enolpyruvyl-6-hydroxy-3-cyclohexene-1-carboxylic-acid synthase [Acidimicrobiia bacterium]